MLAAPIDAELRRDAAVATIDATATLDATARTDDAPPLPDAAPAPDAVDNLPIDASVATPSIDAAVVAPRCGDGNVDPGEQCDDGNDDNTDSCATNCLSTIVTSAADSGDGTLRQLIATLPSGSKITFASSLNGSTISLATQISINTPLTIAGPGASQLAIDGGGATNLLDISATTTISGLALNNGYFAGDGSAINTFGTLTIDSCTFTGNSGSGSGVALRLAAQTTIHNSTFTNNGIEYGAIFNQGYALIVDGSTFVGNHSGSQGSAMNVNSGSADITNSTFINNDSTAIVSGGTTRLAFDTFVIPSNGTAMYDYGTDCAIKNTIVIGNSAGEFGGNAITSGDYNIIDNPTSTVVTASHDVIGQDPGLTVLGSNGGPTQTIGLVANSIAIDAIPSPLCTDWNGNNVTVDQRGQVRPSGNGCDVGAVELGAGTCGDGILNTGEQCDDGNQDNTDACATNCLSTIVTSAADSGNGTLRQLVSALPSGAKITFDPSLDGTTISLATPITINSELTIAGPGAPLLTIDGGGSVQLFIANGDVTMSGLTLSNGNDTDPDVGSGGAMLARAGLSMDRCALVNSTALYAGGALYVEGTTVIANSSFTSNFASSGGAIYAAGEVQSITVENSTFALNSSNSGSAINLNTSGALAVTNSTFASNTGGQGAIINYGSVQLSFVTINDQENGPALFNAGGVFALKNSILIDNAQGNFYSFTTNFSSGDYNLIDLANTGVNDVFLNAGHDQLGSTTTLGVLGDNGGPTQTESLSNGSTAIDAIPVAACTDWNGVAVTTDQRGLPRPGGSTCDIGAFEAQP